LIVLFAAVALLMIGAVPVSAAPGGVPGPPPGHEKSRDDVAPDTDGVEADVKTLPEQAMAYGKRIKDMYDGVPFGHLQQCARVVDGDEAVEDGAGEDDVADGGDESVKRALEACPPNLEFPVGETGAKAFWVFTKAGLLIMGI
jgi:hypothetical protein